METWEVDLRKQLEKWGEPEVRSRLTRGEFKHERSMLSAIEKWLESKEAERKSAREVEALSIARRANEISEDANSIARRALSNSESARREARRANIIATAAMILSAAIAISAIIIGFYNSN